MDGKKLKQIKDQNQLELEALGHQATCKDEDAKRQLLAMGTQGKLEGELLAKRLEIKYQHTVKMIELQTEAMKAQGAQAQIGMTETVD